MCIEFTRPNIAGPNGSVAFGSTPKVNLNTRGLPGEVCRVLLEAGADVNSKNIFGKVMNHCMLQVLTIFQTPFHLACEYGIASLMEEMLHKGTREYFMTNFCSTKHE